MSVRDRTWSASTMFFSVQSIDVSMGYVDLPQSPSIGVLMDIVDLKSLLRVGLHAWLLPNDSAYPVHLYNWQHTSTLLLFLLDGISQKQQNYDDIGWESMTQPLPTESLGNLDEAQQNKEKEFYRRRLVHYHCMHGKVLRSFIAQRWWNPLACSVAASSVLRWRFRWYKQRKTGRRPRGKTRRVQSCSTQWIGRGWVGGGNVWFCSRFTDHLTTWTKREYVMNLARYSADVS